MIWNHFFVSEDHKFIGANVSNEFVQFYQISSMVKLFSWSAGVILTKENQLFVTHSEQGNNLFFYKDFSNTCDFEELNFR
jgi:hypothetical protein